MAAAMVENCPAATEWPPKALELFMLAIASCLKQDPAERPKFNRVVAMLEEVLVRGGITSYISY
jgi:hypothetical protein